MPHRTSLIVRTTLIAFGLIASTQVAHAQRSQESVRVSVSYDIQMPRPETAAETDESMSKARELMYERVNQECVQMIQHFASSCELTQLNINQGMKSGRRSGKGTIRIRADAKYSVELKTAEKPAEK